MVISLRVTSLRRTRGSPWPASLVQRRQQPGDSRGSARKTVPDCEPAGTVLRDARPSCAAQPRRAHDAR